MKYINHIRRKGLLLVLLFVGWATGCPVSAQTIVDVVPDPSTNLTGTDNGSVVQPLESLNVADYGVTFNFSVGIGTTNPAYYRNGANIRLYSGNTFTMESSTFVVERIEFQSVAYQSSASTLSVEIEGDAISYDEETLKYTWENTSHTQNATFRVNDTQLRISSITLTLVGEGGSVILNAPVFSQKSCEFYQPFELTISDINESAATIYYTMDGSIPSAENGTKYTAPITIPIGKDVTVKAVSVSGDNISPVTTAIYRYIAKHLFSVKIPNKNGLNYVYYSSNTEYGEWYDDNSAYITEGDNLYIGFSLNSGYKCKDIKLNGVSQSASGNSFNFVMPSSDVELIIDVTFDPSSPSDPQPGDTSKKYNLYLTSNPIGACSLSGAGSYSSGSEVYLYASSQSGYVFTGWTKDGETISTSNSFQYTMPSSDVVLTANYVYNPSSPSDPQQPTLKHPLTVIASPAGAGTFSISSSEVTYGQEYYVYAYPQSGYKFKGWIVNGVAQEGTSTQLTGIMTETGAHVVGLFVFDPSSPSNPGANYYNSTTGQVIIDDFTQGNFYSALRDIVGYDNFGNVSSIIVKGRMSSDDYGTLSYLTNAVTIDLSRTGGVTTVPGYAFQDLSVANILLSSAITNLGNYIFRNCSNLTSLTVYAQEPPKCSSYTFNGFTKDNCTVFVPAEAIELYSTADCWKDFTILPITDDAHVLQVNLPADATGGKYKNNSIELVNLNSGVRQKYVISDRLLYTFNGLQKDEQYNIYMFSQAGLEIGRIENVTIPDQDIEVTFDSLKELYTVFAKVTTPDGKDVTSDVTVEWLKPLADGTTTYLRKATSLGEIPEGQALLCRVTLNNQLGTIYAMPEDYEFTVNNEQNICAVNLVPFRSIALSGTVVDGDGAALSGASVSVNQTLNGKYSKSYTAKTDRQGKWSISVLDAPETRLTYAATECVNVNDTIGAFESEVTTLDLGKTTLKSIVGARVTYGFTYHAAGSEDIQDYYSDYQNVLVSVFNVTQNRAYNDVSLQYPILAVLDENINVGDELRLTATSKTGAFNPIVDTVVVGENQRAEVTFDIIGKGGIAAAFEMTDNPAVIAMLYSSKGELLKKQTYSEAQTTFTELEDGDYTLVSMGQSDLMNSILRLSNFSEIGLTEGKDYVKNAVKVESGKLSEIKNSEIPAFDESLFYYTNSSTSFSSNKSSITTGNYLTLRAAIDFKGIYKNDISNVALVVDLPEACDFVEQSVIQGPNLLPYTIDNNRLTVQLGNSYTAQTRFCVIPTNGGSFNATASIVFDYNGKTLTQPIGSAISDVKDLELSIPAIINSSIFTVKGKAPSKSKIQIFDRTTKIGETISNGYGIWSTTVVLSDSSIYSQHPISAKVYLPNGVEVDTEIKNCRLNPKYIQPETTVMSFYNGWLHRTVSVVFDHITKQIDNANYMFYTTTNISFQTKFSDGDPDLITNVQIHLMDKNGDVHNLPMLYDDDSKLWVACGDFGFDTTPVNISISYDYFDDSILEPLAITQNVVEDFGNYGISNLNKSKTYASFDILPCRVETSVPCIIKMMDPGDLEEFISQIEGIGFSLSIGLESQLFYCDQINNFVIVEPGDTVTVKAYFSSRDEVFNTYNNLVGGINRSSSPQRVRVDLNGNYYRSTDRLNRWVDEHIMNDVIAMMDRKRSCNENNTQEWNNAVLAMGRLQQIFAASIYSILGSTFNLASLAQRPRDIVDYGLLGANLINQDMPFPEADPLYQRAQYELEIIRNLPECSPCNRSRAQIRSKAPSNQANCPHGNCGNDSGNDFPPMSPIHDPSGYVYEAVPENRVEGVQATIYYKETKEDMYGDPYEEIVLWNAEEYAQENPLFTDENGMYRWDVPQGLWQVKFEKDGYVTAYSEWLPVPPPQLEVNIGIVQNKQPEVTEARAYEEGVEVQFDKFMDLSTLTTDNIYVTANGEKLTGSIRLIDSALADEYADEEDSDALRYASRVRFVPEETLSATTGEIRVTVSRNVLSYAGIPMTETFSQVLDVEKEVQTITADDVKVLYGGEKEITIYALPYEAAVGRTLHIANSSELITSVDKTEATIDGEGKATVIVKGDLPGRAQLTFSIDDVTATGECAVDVVTEIINAEVPKSSRASGTAVYRGTKVELTTESKDGVIYFTTDGSCPCDENGTRRKYTVPIIINEDTKILAMTTVGTGSDDVSETVEFNYTLKRSDMDFAMDKGWTWISHNFETPIAAETLAADENVQRIISQKQEVIRDPQLGMVGMLQELNASESYKVETTSATARHRLSEIAWNPATPIALNSGWNWLGYPVSQTMSVDEAFAPTAAENLDVIVGQNGFAQFDGENWVGTLETLSPGLGYMYQSQSPKNVVYNTSIVSTASARYVAGTSQNSPLVLDIHKYPSIMPVVATIKNVDGMNLDNEDYQVNAFCGTECRGIGRVVNGLVMMNVYGNTNDKITFQVTDNDGAVQFVNNSSLSFSEQIVGNLNEPYTISINSYSGISDVTYDGNIKVSIVGDMLVIKGIAADDIDLVEVYDIDGQKLIHETKVNESGIRISNLNTGVYIVIVNGNSEYTYHKIALR